MYGGHIRSWVRFESPEGRDLSLNFPNVSTRRVGVSGGGLADAGGDEAESSPGVLYFRIFELLNGALDCGMDPLYVRTLRFGRLILAGTPPISGASKAAEPRG